MFLNLRRYQNTMKLAVLISGGKDSIYSAYKASKDNELVCLITFRSKRNDSYMFHIPNIELTKLIAKSMNLPLIFAESSGIKEKELKDIEKALKKAIKEYNIFEVLGEFKPNIICLGYDQKTVEEYKLKEELKKRNINADIVRAKPYKEHIFKSSKM